MRYRSPQAQLLILYGVFLINGCIPALTVRSATGIVPPEHRFEYAGTWKQQMTYGLSFIAGIFAVNLLGARVVLFFGGLCGILYATGIICAHKYSIHGLYLAGTILNSIGYAMGMLAVNTMVLTYPREQQKARAVAVFLISLELFLTLGDVMLKSEGGEGRNWNSAVVQLVFICIGTPLTLLLSPAEQVVRDTGVYVLAVPAKAQTEIGKVLEVLGSVWLWLLVPFIFSFPFVTATAGMVAATKLSAVVTDLGSLAALALGSVLDTGSVTRRRRGLYGFFFYVLLVVVTLALLVALVAKHAEGNGGIAGLEAINKYRIEHHEGLYYAASFFSGMGGTCTLLFTLWIIGTLTNHFDATVRFLGLLLAVQMVGGLVGGRSISGEYTQTPLYVGCGILVMSLACVWMVADKIPDTNNWSLSQIDEAALADVSLVGEGSDQNKSD